MDTAIDVKKPSEAAHDTTDDLSPGQLTHISVDQAEERRIVRKTDAVMIPLLMVCYMLQFLDKSSLNYASILGIIKDTHLVGQQYSWTSSIFYFGYLIFSYPTSLMIVKFPLGKYVSSTVLIWAGIIMMHAACHNFAGLMAVRFFLGVAEATVAPAFAILVGTFYKRSEQPLRQCLWFVGNALAGVFGGLIGYGIAHIKSDFALWKYLFLIFGAATVLWSLVMLFFLPNDPSTARFLTSSERITAVARLQTSANKKVTTWKRSQLVEALVDPQTWLLFLYTFCINVGNGGLSSFGSLIIKGFGYSTFQTLLLQLPVAFAQVFWILLVALLATYLKNARLFIMFGIIVMSLIGVAMMFGISNAHPKSRLAGFCMTTAYVANLPLSLSLVTSNVAGFTKKTTVMSLIFISYCTGNIAGPQFFKSSEAPRYQTGLKTGVATFAIGALLLVLLRFFLAWENKRRSTEVLVPLIENGKSHEVAIMDEDLTDRENRAFRYEL